jgi:hypothetical protein
MDIKVLSPTICVFKVIRGTQMLRKVLFYINSQDMRTEMQLKRRFTQEFFGNLGFT